jgi:hypothetical protein
MIPGIVLLLSTFAAAVTALPLDPANGSPVATLWTFSNETWIENLAVRANGNVLCTSLNRAAIYQVDPFKSTDAVPLGVNGIHILNSELYFTNLATNSVGKVTITPDGGAAGTIQVLTTKALAADDFALSDKGIVYAAGANTLRQVSTKGRTVPFVGDPNSTVLQGITSARFGRTAVDKDVLYLSTQGGLLENPPGSIVHGGQLLAVNVNVVASHDDED